MSLNTIKSVELKRLISIVERKERLQDELREIESTLATYLSLPATPAPRTPRRTRKSGAVRVSEPPLEVKAPKSNVQQAEAEPGQRRGALKDSILAALQKADGAGIPIKELSRTLGVKAPNLHVWFSSTGRKVKGVTKVGAGRWAYESTASPHPASPGFNPALKRRTAKLRS
jgi:hypothetical protein